MCERLAGARGRPASGQEDGFQRVEGPLRYFWQGTNGLQMSYEQATSRLRMSYELGTKGFQPPVVINREQYTELAPVRQPQSVHAPGQRRPAI
jgi:hypothetical protein